MTEEETTRSPRVADDRSLSLSAADGCEWDVSGRQRSVIYDAASPCSALYVSRHSFNWTRCGIESGRDVVALLGDDD